MPLFTFTQDIPYPFTQDDEEDEDDEDDEEDKIKLNAWCAKVAVREDPRLTPEETGMLAQFTDETRMRQFESFSSSHGNAIHSRWQTLRDILDRHEEMIHSRWTKKTIEKRRSILLKAWPDMPKIYKPDTDFTPLERRNFHRGHEAERLRVLLPYICQDDLCRSNTLLLLLNARGRHLPGEFAAADLEQMNFAHVFRQPINSDVPLYSILLDVYVEDELDVYGRLINYETMRKTGTDLEGWRGLYSYHVGEGVSVLEAQSKLLDILVTVCKLILHDKAADSLITDYPVLPAPSIKEDQASGIISVAALAPYRVPSKLGLDKIESLLSAQASVAQDRLRSLREDPLDFAEQLMDEMDHRHELIKDEKGQLDPVTRQPDVFWSLILKNLFRDVFYDVEVYSELKRYARNVLKVQSIFAEFIGRPDYEHQIPPLFEEVLTGLYIRIDNAIDNLLAILEVKAPAAPRTRSLWVRHPSQKGTHYHLHATDSKSRSAVVDRLFQRLEDLKPGSEARRLEKIPLWINELERLLRAEPEANHLISPYIARVIGDLSVLSQCKQQLWLYHPWSRKYKHAVMERFVLEEQCDEHLGAWDSVFDGIDHTDLEEPLRLLEPFKKTFPYPIDQVPTEENVKALRCAERNLDKLWNSVISIINVTVVQVGAYTPGLTTTMETVVKHLPRMYRTPKWIPTPLSPEVVTTTTTTTPPVQSIYEPLSQLAIDTPEPTPTQPRAAKTKTRRTTTTTPDTPSEPETQKEKTNPPKQVYEVSKRTLAVFRTLFYVPEVDATPGELPWKEFCHAMTSMGFTMFESAGSACTFTPGELGKSITFHAPHGGASGKGKIPFYKARRHGRRLTRKFGWERESFVLKKSGEAANIAVEGA